MSERSEIIEINNKEKEKKEVNNLKSDVDGKERQYGCCISAHKLEEIMGSYKERGVEFRELKYFKEQNGVSNLVNSLLTNEINGITSTEYRKKLYESNKVFVEFVLPFYTYVWDALGDIMVRILIVFAVIQIVLDYTLSGDPSKDWIECVSIIVALFVVVLVRSLNNYQK